MTVEDALIRRQQNAEARASRDQWFIEQAVGAVSMPMRQRVRLAVEYLKTQVVRNLSRPVRKFTSQITGRITVDPTSRSVPGEFPRADTTLLMTTIFADYRESSPNVHDGYVGTPLDYGMRLELGMLTPYSAATTSRSFLVRTLAENEMRVRQILTGPVS